MDTMDDSLIPFDVVAPPVPVQPHLAPLQPSQAELEVPFPLDPQSSKQISHKRAATPLGRKDI